MRDLTAQVTSSLLPFPGVTIDALGEDEIILDSVLQGKFTVGRSGVAWLACGPQLEVVHAVTGERLSAYCFSGEGEHPPNILAARDFSWLKRSGLLVGLEEVEGSMLCLYDLSLSRVVKAVVIPGRITAIEPLVSYGGASTSTQHLHQSLRWFFGIAAVVTDLGHVLLVDLCLDDLSCSQSELEASDLEVVTKSPAEIPRLREASGRQGRHLCLQLSGPSGTKATALQYISRTNQIAVGFSDGYLQLWNMKTLKKEYHSQLEAGKVPVYAFTFQEPENDPRNCCYLWAVQSAQELEGDVVSLHLLQLAFSERKCMASGKILYEGLEYCEERYSQDVSGTAFPLRAQATNTRLLSCQTIEKFRPHPDRDDSMNEVASPDTSVSIFSWQVKAYGVFDINRWYHAQMPDSLRAGESLHSCPYLAVWSLDPVVEMVSPRPLLDIVVHDRSLSRGLPCTWPPPEQFFNPTTYNFGATCLLNSGIVHLTCSGHQKETLSFLKKAAPCSSDFICSSYTRCLMSGLLSSRQADSHHGTPSQEEQLDAILCTAVETSSLGLITGCIKQWTAEATRFSLEPTLHPRVGLEQGHPHQGRARRHLYVQGLHSAPLFDSSSNFTDPQTLQLLQHSQRLLGNLSAIFHCLLSEAQELTQRGLVGLMNKNMVSSLISQYAQVVLWFCRTGLLPEGSDEDALQISRPFYTHAVISSYYTIRREELTRLAKGKWCTDCLMIDGLVSQCGERLVNLWKRDEGGTGQYPPPTLHALLDIYLLEDMDEAAKHAIVIYLLLDVMYSFPNKGGASVESFPTAFAVPIGLVKLVQGLWLLDHRDHQSSVELLLHPTTSQCHFPWQHERVLQALMCQGRHAVALRYLHVTKPPLSSTSQAKLCLSVLLHNRCLVEAWSLLRQHSTRLSREELLGFLYESCQELGLITELLKLPLSLTEQECLEKFLQGTGGLHNRELLMVHYLQQANYIPALQLNHTLKMNLVNERDPKLRERSNTRNAILDQYGKVLPRVQRRLAMERAKPYHHPTTIHREVNRPQPLSTIAKRSSNDKVMSRAGFINSVLTKIEEVWLGKGATPHSSPLKSPRTSETQSPSSKPCSNTLTDPFLGTPIAMTARRKSRLMDLVVHPSCQTPQSFLSPLRAPGSVVPPRIISRAPELSLLQTPQVVKRARALAASGGVFSAFTPHSILRSSLRPTPVATPSASPGRSVTPPLRSKESRITFIEESASPEMGKGPVPWSNGMAADSEISLLTRGSPLPSSALKHWASQAPEEEEEQPPRVTFMPPAGGIPSPQLRGSESDSSSVQEVMEAKSSVSLVLPVGSLPGRLSLGLETSLTSVQSSDSTLEFHDALLGDDPEEQRVDDDDEEEEDVVIINIKAPAEPDGLTEKSITATDEEEVVEEEQSKEDAQRAITSEGDDKMVCPQQAQRDTEEEVLETRVEEEDEGESASQQGSQPCLEAQEPGYTEGHDILRLDGDQASTVEAVVCDTRVEGLEQPEKTCEQSEVTEPPEATQASETLQEPTESLEHSTDLTEFVERHLFGDDPAPLTRSGIHDAVESWTSLNSEPVCEDPEDNTPLAEAPTLTSQKSVTSITSSEPSGSDSHCEDTHTRARTHTLTLANSLNLFCCSGYPVFWCYANIPFPPTAVVSVNDSEELSSPATEEEEEEDEEEEDDDDDEEEGSDESEEEEDEEKEEDEEEDSGSEVEIIEEVQGNRTLVSLQPEPLTPLFEDEELPHFLSRPSEVLSLIPAEAELKMVGDGEVVMVRLGGLGGGDEVDDGSSFTELKPSTTLLVPLELVEGHGHSLVDGAQLGLTVFGKESESDSPTSGAHSSFSLMLEMEDVDPEADTLPMENHQQALQLAVQGITDQLVAPPEAILQDINEPDMHDSRSEEPLDLLVAEDPVVEAADPVVEAEHPVVEAADPAGEAEDPVVEAEDPVVEAEDPVVEAEDPVVEAEDPVVEAEDPVVEAEDPVVEAADPVVEAADPVVEAKEDAVMEAKEDPVMEAKEDPVMEAEVDPVVEAEEDPVVEAEEDPMVEAEEDPVVEAEEDPVVEAEEDPVVEAEEDPVVEAADPMIEAADQMMEDEDPVAEAADPMIEAADQMMEDEDPVAEAADPVAEAADPVAEAADPVAEAAEPVAQAAEPVAQVAEPVAQAAEPVAQAAEPVAQAAEPVAQAAEPVAQAAEPVAQAAEPVAQAAEPVAQAAELVAEVDTLDAIEIDEQSPQPDCSPFFLSEDITSNIVIEEAAKEKDSELMNTEINNEEEPESEAVSLEVPLAVANKKVPTSRYAALEAMMEESTHTPSENTLISDTIVKDLDAVPEESLPVQKDGHENAQIFLNTESVATLEEDQQQTKPGENMEERREEFNILQEQSRRRTLLRASENQKDKDSHVRQVFSSDDPLDPEPNEKPPITTSQKLKAPSTPTRRATRGRKTVTFTSSPQDKAEDTRPEEEEEEEKDLGEFATPRRGTRARRQSQNTQLPANTPRRSTRKTQARSSYEEDQEEEEEEMDKEEPMNNEPSVPRTTRSTPAKRRTPQKASPSRAGRRTRSSAMEEVENEPEEAMNNMHDEESRSMVPTPAKRQTRQSVTPRRASRRTSSMSEETVEEETEPVEEEQGSVTAAARKANIRISRIRYFEAQPALLEVEEDEPVVKKKAASSPSRVTRASNRPTPSIQPQVKLTPWSTARKRGGDSAAKPAPSEPVLTDDAPPTTISRRRTRNKLWEHSEEDLPFLDPPLEVDSQTPVADALIKRLKDEEEKEGGPVNKKTANASRRKTKLSVERDLSPPVSTDDDPAPEPENDSTKDSFIYSPSRRRTRTQRGGSPILSELELPTRTRRTRTAAVGPAKIESVSQDDATSTATVSKSTTMIKSTAKWSKAALAVPLASVDLISPLPSPAETVPRAQKRTEEGEDAGARMSRRKRIMNTVFTKPVTRRKKL
ncbi:Protein ELYS [Merluccius polli]|uniref:Protein ELYS n=1 Tax=Merluccius polli TaxID=89951 RepID=A0AA47MKE1_MERPO|nr:Protein ELYS [Merluccius polli]